MQNFENLNPANTFWDKYYHVFANVDTEPPRFLEFERWWGGFYLMNREEIEWITQNLFVGNKLWSGQVRARDGHAFDLRDIRSPIVLFASMGDNITPPQQAFNWVADVYGSTDEIKASGQVIVGLLHQDIGHLGIFVSGRVAKKEHAQIVSVLKSIEALAPGLYGMQIRERNPPAMAPSTRSSSSNTASKTSPSASIASNAPTKSPLWRSRQSPNSTSALTSCSPGRWSRRWRPSCRPNSSRFFHPLRAQRWAVSDLNPWLAWLGPAAEMVKAHRRALGPDAPLRQLEAHDVRVDQRLPGLLPRAARRRERGAVLPNLWQPLLSLPRRPAPGRGAPRAGRGA